jgi:hypothetical protein
MDLFLDAIADPGGIQAGSAMPFIILAVILGVIVLSAIATAVLIVIIIRLITKKRRNDK